MQDGYLTGTTVLIQAIAWAAYSEDTLTHVQ